MADAATLNSCKPQVPTGTPVDASILAPSYAYAMLSHCGRVRHSNQDACAALPEHGVYVVCDGMGGATGGEVASHLATEVFLYCLSHRHCPPLEPAAPKSTTSNFVRTRSPRQPEDDAQPDPATQTSARLAEAICSANQTVYRNLRKSPSLHGMGTTLVALLWEEVTPQREDARLNPAPTLWIAHVGDSRCYHFRSGALQLLTQDHSLVEEQMRAGLLSRVQAIASPMRNIITRAIGTQPTVEPEITSHTAQPGDLYLLASDGLSRELDDSEIAAILSRTAGPASPTAARRNSTTACVALRTALDNACRALVEAANAKGGRDNITVLLVACP